MELNFEFHPSFFNDGKCDNTKHIKYGKDEQKGMCLVCMCDDTEDSKKWDRYEIYCGHQYHTRCLRKYWDTIEKPGIISCSYCGDKPISRVTKYCGDCKVWGHDPYECLQRRVREMEEEERRDLRRLLEDSSN
jgi:hypothetical protein